MFHEDNLPNLIDCIDGMLTERYSPEQASRLLKSLGVSQPMISSIEHVAAAEGDRIMALTDLADKAYEMHLNHGAVRDLVDYAYETDYLSQGDAYCLLTGNGIADETARHHLEAIAAIKNRDASRAEYLEHPELDRRYCTVCGRKVPRRKLSKRGLCQNCIEEIQDAVTVQLATKDGPYYRRWREGMLRALYRLEDEEIAEGRAIQDAKPMRTLGDYIEQTQHECDDDCENCPVDICSLRHGTFIKAIDDGDERDYDLGGPQAQCSTNTKYADNDDIEL